MSICTEREYHSALKRIYDLMRVDPPTGSQEATELQQLVAAVDQFEGSRFPMTCCAFAARDCAERVLALLRKLGGMFDLEHAVQWCETPQPVLDGQRPVDMLITEKGAVEVDDALSRALAGQI